MAHEADDDWEVGRFQIFAHVADEIFHVLGVLRGERAVHVVPALEPNEARQLVAAPVVVREALLELLQVHLNLLHHQPIKMPLAVDHLFAEISALFLQDHFFGYLKLRFDFLACDLRIILLGLIHSVAYKIVVFAVDHIVDRFIQLFLGRQSRAWRPEIAPDAFAAPSRLDDQYWLLVVIAHHVTEFQFRSDAPGRAEAHC